MSTPSDSTDRARQRRARAKLVGCAGLGLVAAAGAVLLARGATPAPSAMDTAATGPRPSAADSPAPDAAALARAPMLQLPAQAALPQQLSTRTAGAPISLPHPEDRGSHWVPTGFPPSPHGALAQLVALTETGLAGGDPAVYARAYRQLSQPGAPSPPQTPLAGMLATFRDRAQLPDTGPVEGLQVRWEAAQGLVKGTAEQGRYVVACALGQVTVHAQVERFRFGAADCQAMRWTSEGWRIAAGPLAAPATHAWPGSAAAVKAGYRELVR